MTQSIHFWLSSAWEYSFRLSYLWHNLFFLLNHIKALPILCSKCYFILFSDLRPCKQCGRKFVPESLVTYTCWKCKVIRNTYIPIQSFTINFHYFYTFAPNGAGMHIAIVMPVQLLRVIHPASSQHLGVHMPFPAGSSVFFAHISSQKFKYFCFITYTVDNISNFTVIVKKLFP